MAYNKENYRRVCSEFENKYLKTRMRIDERRRKIEADIPEIAEINSLLAENGPMIMVSVMHGDAETLDKLKEDNVKLRKKRSDVLVKHGYAPDYIDIQYDCRKCNDTGFYDGKMCECMKRELSRAAALSSGLGKLLDEQKFDNFSLEYYNGEEKTVIEKNVEILKNYAENFDGKNDENIILVGDTGLGKTHLSTAVAGKVIDKGFDVLYTPASSLIAIFEKQRFGDGHIGDGNERPYYETELLIIDDLGVEITNQFTLTSLTDLISDRLLNGRATVISTNLSSDVIRERYGDRLASRIFGGYRPLVFKGTDIRMQKLKKSKQG